MFNTIDFAVCTVTVFLFILSILFLVSYFDLFIYLKKTFAVGWVSFFPRILSSPLF